MNLKKNTIHKTIIIIFHFTLGFCDGIWVNYGWELFEYVIDARSASLGTATTAYNFNTTQSSMANPSFTTKSKNNMSITHQSRFAGTINSELFGIQLNQKSKILNLNIVYQGISNIPDTRYMLLDWGEDGQFGTNDAGEGNGVIDNGERLDQDKLKFFNQYQLGLHSSFGSKLFDIPIGLAFKILSYSLDKNFAFGVGIDIGYNTIINKTSLGLVVKNFPASGMMWENGTIEGTTPSVMMGLGHSLNGLFSSSLVINKMLNLECSSSNANLDSDYRYKNFSVDASYGLEAIYKQNLMVRIGKNSVNNITGGLGLKWDYMSIDYAFLSSLTSSEIGNHHLITINLSYNWILYRLKS